MKYLLYGANGYTANLIIQESLKQGLHPILAGRTKEKIEKIANEYKLPFRIFSLDNPNEIEQHLGDVKVCLNAAGPFSKTASPMAKACAKTKTHYLDITGEVEVFENLKHKSKLAEDAGVMFMPGVGFDVVPSDCLANHLNDKMPDATELQLAFTSVGGGLSHGTATTMAQHLGESSAARVNGELIKVPVAHVSKIVDFGKFKRSMGSIPWGDVSTAYTSTGIPNITVLTDMPKSALKMMKFQKIYNPLLRLGIVKKMASMWIDKNLHGPTPEQNEKGKSFLKGVVSNGKEEKSVMLKCAEGYKLTALCGVEITKRVLEGNFKAGYQTPAMVYGWEFILDIEGSEFI